MTDHLSAQKRSWNMGRIKAKHTNPEIAVRSMLHKMGYRFKLHNEKLMGKPDIVLPKYKTVIFVHGCFWHRHNNCSRSTFPKSNKEYWNKKFSMNKTRFAKVKDCLEKQGWVVVVVWECEIKNQEELKHRLIKILSK
jgi:DNA mismatch endonuclease, patch repair protein